MKSHSMLLVRICQKKKKKIGKEEGSAHFELQKNPLLGIGARGPMRAEVRVEDEGSTLRRRLLGRRPHLESERFDAPLGFPLRVQTLPLHRGTLDPALAPAGWSA